MTPEQFAYWLQGYSELNPNNPPSVEQWKLIQAHLNLVFDKRTPNIGESVPVQTTEEIRKMIEEWDKNFRDYSGRFPSQDWYKVICKADNDNRSDLLC